MQIVPVKLKRFLRVPSFGLAYALNIAILLSLIYWIYVDAYLWTVLRSVGTVVGLDTYEWAPATLKWDHLGPRALLFVALVSIGGLSLGIVCARLFVGRRSGRSLTAWMATTALLGSWMSLVLTTNDHTGAEFRVRRDLPRFKAIVAAFSRGGFSDQIRLDGGDVIRVPTGSKRAEFYVDEFDGLSCCEAIGMGAELANGGFLLILQARRYTVEYHPDGSQPSDLPSGFLQQLIKKDLLSVAELSNGWFLTQYELAIE